MKTIKLTDDQVRRILDLRSHVLTENDQIKGWLQNASALAIWGVLERQIIDQVRGDVLEIGVFHGKTFIMMARSLGEEEAAVAVDMFEMEFNGEDGRELTHFRDHFELNLANFCNGKNVTIHQAMSSDFAARVGKDQHGRYRMISIDGSHDAPDVLSDLLLAEKLLSDRGIVVVDDYMSLLNPGVVEGVDQYLRMESPASTKLVPLVIVEADQPSEACGGHRLFMCGTDMIDYYSSVFRENHPEKFIKIVLASAYKTKILRFTENVYKRRMIDYDSLEMD